MPRTEALMSDVTTDVGPTVTALVVDGGGESSFEDTDVEPEFAVD